MHRNLALFSLVFFLAYFASAQETLPKFSAIRKPNGKTIISWKNNYPVVNQISIQRSTDSLKNYTTLLSVPDPSVSENGFVDSKSIGPRVFYRLFILLDSGHYLFTKPLRPIVDTTKSISETSKPELSPANISPAIVEDNDNGLVSKSEKQRLSYTKRADGQVTINAPGNINAKPEIALNKIIYIKKEDSVIGQLFEKSVKKFRDSILKKTKDTLVFQGDDSILIKPFVPKEVYKISSFVYATKESNVNISLPDADRKKYSVKFFEIDGSPLFEIKEIPQPFLIVDKTNFVHAGWFRFELFEDGKLKEKNKFFIQNGF